MITNLSIVMAPSQKSSAKQIFINLPVKDLEKTKTFFSNLGFSFNPEFTDENAACLIIGENMFSMLLLEKFFKSFISKDISDTAKSAEVLIALSVESREKVDWVVKTALSLGGKEAYAPKDYGWMYSRAFEDLDGHIWEVFYGDEAARKKK